MSCDDLRSFEPYFLAQSSLVPIVWDSEFPYLADVPLSMIPDKRQGSLLEEVKPTPFRISVIILYQC